MPSIESLPSKQLAQAYFEYVLQKTLPVKWVNPALVKGADHYAKYSGGPGPMDWMVHIAGIPALLPDPYFWAATTNKYHRKAASDIGEKTKKFVDTALDKFKQAHDYCRAQAKIKDLKIMALCAIGTPGCLDMPKLADAPSFKSWPDSYKEKNGKAYAKAVVEGLSGQFDKWASKVMVPGLPWYPAFATYPGPSAAPLPNIPMPLIVCPSPMMAEVVQMKLKKAMVDALDKRVKDNDADKHHEAIFDAIAFPISLNFLLWLLVQQIMNVLGKGPVPVFAPPYVPLGPVLAGDNIATPGHLAT
ncbi:MAG: hypothetical protein CSA66_01155 [Proteobacteria bacterium]|nr:MAG: hypothetical protein CSA66_01155 [Pseudomonadota bacterium]